MLRTKGRFGRYLEKTDYRRSRHRIQQDDGGQFAPAQTTGHPEPPWASDLGRTSRKSFLGKVLDVPVEQRLTGSLACCAIAIMEGAHIVRVHDVRETRQVATLCDAVRELEASPMSIAELINLDKLNWNAAIDILIVSTLIYNLLLLIRGTRAVQMALGLGVLAIFFYLTRWLHLEMIQWILTNILPYFVFGIIVLFAAEIRRALANIGKNPLIRQFSQNPFVETYDEIVLAATTLASQRIGGLIVIERSIGLKNYIESGIAIDAALSYDLLVAIFSPGAPLHDGAVIVQKDRITAAACFLPLTVNPKLSKDLGTRHRAAIGVTEESDAIVVVISEETGIISIVAGGQIERSLDGESLRHRLETIFAGKDSEKEMGLSAMLERP